MLRITYIMQIIIGYFSLEHHGIDITELFLNTALKKQIGIPLSFMIGQRAGHGTDSRTRVTALAVITV